MACRAMHSGTSYRRFRDTCRLQHQGPGDGDATTEKSVLLFRSRLQTSVDSLEVCDNGSFVYVSFAHCCPGFFDGLL